MNTKPLPTLRLDLPSALLVGSKNVVILEDCSFNPRHTLEIVDFLKPLERYVHGREMLKRAAEGRNRAGWQHAQYLIIHKEFIPEEWQPYILIFPGTTLIGERGNKFFPFLAYGADWFMAAHSFDMDCTGDCRTVHFK